jgi:hypothetical protein
VRERERGGGVIQTKRNKESQREEDIEREMSSKKMHTSKTFDDGNLELWNALIGSPKTFVMRLTKKPKWTSKVDP